MKKILPLGIILATIISCTNFDKAAKPFFVHLEELYEYSTLKSDVVTEVWRTAIYDKKYSFTGKYVSDFNEALYMMKESPVVKRIDSKIDSMLLIVESEIKDIPKSKDESYSKLISLYTNIVELSKLARTPAGSLQSYNNEVDDLSSDIRKLFTEMTARNPNLQK